MAVKDRRAAKKPVNLSVNADLLRRARELDVNLSEAFELKLAELIAAAEREQWRAEARPAIKRYNERIENEPILSDEFRTF